MELEIFYNSVLIGATCLEVYCINLYLSSFYELDNIENDYVFYMNGRGKKNIKRRRSFSL